MCDLRGSASTSLACCVTAFLSRTASSSRAPDEDVNVILAAAVSRFGSNDCRDKAWAELQTNLMPPSKARACASTARKAQALLPPLIARSHRRWRLPRFHRQTRGRHRRRQRCHGLRAHGGASAGADEVSCVYAAAVADMTRARRAVNSKRHCRRRGNVRSNRPIPSRQTQAGSGRGSSRSRRWISTRKGIARQ